MKCGHIVSCLLGAAGMLAVMGSVAALAEPEKKSMKAAQPAAKDKAHDMAHEGMDPMMEAWMQAAIPGEHHKQLAFFAGTWTTKSKFWMDPTSETPQESEGKSVNELVLGGRFVKSHYTSEFMGQPFEGYGYLGYDNITKQHIGLWMDSMTTGVMMDAGQCDPTGKIFTMVGSFKEPSGQDIKSTNKWTIIDNNTWKLEMWHAMPGMDEMKVGEIVYTRAK